MTLKVLYLPLNSMEIKQTGMVDAFRKANVELKVFDFNLKILKRTPAREVRQELITVASKFAPHLMHMQLQFTSIIDAGTLKRIKQICPNTIITNWTGDVRKGVQTSFVEVAKVANISLVSSAGQVAMYKRASGGRDVRYWQIGYNPKLYYPQRVHPKEIKYDAIFAASNHTRSGFPGHGQRKQTVDLLYRNFKNRFGLFGYGWKRYHAKYMPQGRMNDVYNRSISCISVSNFNDLSHYFSDRLLMCLASGRPTISLAFPGWDSYFTDMTDILIARNVREIPAKVKWLVANPKLATEIGEAGAIIAQAEHTYYSRVKELLYMTGLS